MIIIKGTTKKGQELLKKSQNWEGKYLSQVYNSYSKAKEKAWNDCFKKCLAENGEQFSIISHNSFQFSVGWFVENGARIETSSNSYLVLFPEFC